MKMSPLILATVLLSGCASYHTEPLATRADTLAAPDSALLSRQAATLKRGFLTPKKIDLSKPLDSDAVAVLAVLANPDLKALRARAGVADAQVFDAGLMPDPVLSAGIDHILSGPDPVDNLAAALGLDLNALRTRSARRRQATAQARQVRLDLAWAEWQTAGKARIAASRIIGLARISGLAKASQAATRTVLDATLKAAKRGDVPAARLQAAQLAASNADQAARQAERDLATARLDLNRLLGLPPDYHIDLQAMPLPAPPPDKDALFSIATTSRADLRALQAGYAAQEAAVHKAVLDQFPSLDLTVNATRDTGDNKLIGPAVSFTLPLWNRNRGGIAIERATRAALKAEYDARLFQTRADIAAAVSSLAILRRQQADLAGRLPAIRDFAQASQRAANRGDLASATAVAAEQTLRDQETQLIQSRMDMADEAIALELLTGLPRERWTSGEETGK